MELGLANKVVLVTGGSRGIGRGAVEAFAAQRAKVVFTFSASSQAAADLASDLQDRFETSVAGYAADVRSEGALADLMATIEEKHGRLDVLVNNAGIVRDGLLLGMEKSDWTDVIETNLTGLYNCIRPAARLMLRQRQGAIVNLSSMAGSRPGRGHANYAASKGGVEAMTKALAVELAPKKIRVNAVAPGMIETDMSKEVRALASDQILERIALKRFGQVTDIVNAILFLASDVSSYVTGEVLHVDGGIL